MGDNGRPQPEPDAAESKVTCACGAAWPADFRFCGACGLPLAQEPAATEVEERKVVTALFADLAASTELASRLDPEDFRAVLRPFFTRMAEEIERFGGTVEKFIGDAVVAVFGVPVAHEDDPERAVRAALAMQRRLEALNLDAGPSGGEPLAMRIGVNTGEVVTTTGIDRDLLVTGEAVNIAARFESLARPGGVVVGERTHRDTHHAIRYRSLGEVRVKGIDRPLSAWEAVGEHAVGEAVPPGRMGLAPLVGRDEELALLDLLFARVVREGRPGLATLVGPAGIGKSRLSQEFVDRTGGRRPVRVVRGRCLAYGEGLTYWPLAEILKADAAILDSDAPDAILDKAEAVLRPRFRTKDDASAHTRVLLASIGIQVSPDPLAGTDPVAARETIARSWRTYFESLADHEPVIALVEDLHWADESLLDLLENVAARGTRPILLLCTTRPDLTDRRSSWGGGLRSSTTVGLFPLSEREGEQLLRHLLGGLSVPEEVVRPILDRAEGNPFFAQELLRMIVDSGALVRREDGWVLERALPEALPDTVQGVLASRIDMIAPEEKRALQDAAVVGRVFWTGAVERLGTPEAHGVLEALVERGLIWERPDPQIEGEREFAFNHVLTQDVAYASIPKSRRKQAHAAALGWMEEVTEGRFEEFAEILAHHAELSGDPARTARYAILAGHRSRRVFAAHEAIRWYDRALAAAGAGPEADRTLVAEAALARGEAREQLGEFAAAQADYEIGIEASGQAGAGLLEARSLAALAHVHWLQDRFEEGRRVLDQALERARAEGGADLLATLLYTAGTLAFGQGRYAEALPFHEEAVRVAREAGDRAGEAMGRHGLCETLYFTGPFERSLAEGRRADELFRALGQRPMVYHNLYMVGWALWSAGRIEDSIAAFDESLAGCIEVGNRRDEGFAANYGLGYWHRGQLSRALDGAARTVEIAREIQTPRLELVGQSSLMQMYMEARDWDRAAEHLADSRRISDALGSGFIRARLLAAGGWFALREGSREEADRLFGDGRELSAGVLLDELWTGLVELLAGEDLRDEALVGETADRLQRAASGQSVLFEAWALYGKGLAAELGGRWEEAETAARQAAERAREMGDRALEWRGWRITAKALAALGRHSEAEPARARTAAVLGEVVAGIDEGDLRRSFLGRPDVQEAMGGGSLDELLADLSPEEAGGVLAVARPRRYAPGESVFRRGDPATGLFVVQEGQVNIGVEDSGVVLAELGPREFFGEVALLDGAARTADAVSEGETLLLELPRDEFLRLLESRPALAERLTGILDRRLGQDRKALQDSASSDIPGRLAAAIQHLSEAEGRTAPAIEILPVWLRDGAVWWLHPARSSSLTVPSAGSQPGAAVVAALARYGVEPRAVHSTSWRTEADRLVLTYLAVLEELVRPPDGLVAEPVRRTELARGSATGAPSSIEVGHVLEHALRHFAWLVKDDPVIRDLFGERWAPVLESYTPEPFRSLDASGTVRPDA